MEENPFPDLHISPSNFLDTLETRQLCSSCHKSRKYYCYSCFRLLPCLVNKVPIIKLPYKVHIIKHPYEVCGKSTAVHAAILAPADVTIFIYPDILDYKNSSKAVLVCPGVNSVTLEQYIEQRRHSPNTTGKSTIEVNKSLKSSSNLVDNRTYSNGIIQTESSTVCDISEAKQLSNELENVTICCDTSETYDDRIGFNVHASTTSSDYKPSGASEDVETASSRPKETCEGSEPADGTRNTGCSSESGQDLETVVFIDSTWFQVHKILSDERLAGLQKIELESQETKFWRHQLDKPTTYLSTIEAIYYSLREYHHCRSETDYDGQYDDLLFFFLYFYRKIKALCDQGKTMKAYHCQRRKKMPKSAVVS